VDVFKSLDTATESAPSLNTNKLRNQLKKLNKQEQGSLVLDAPVPARKRVKQEQAANYKINQGKLGKYIQ
jgi:hypothetical protein